MPARSAPSAAARIPALVARHQQLHDPGHEPRNRLRWLRELRRWQAERLRRSFAQFLENPQQRPAAEFFLTDVYGDHDFARRDEDIARVMPMMQRLLPAPLLDTVAAGIELGALTHELDLDVAQALERLAPRRRKLDAALYAQAYREAGDPDRRARQIALIERVGAGLARAMRGSGVAALLRLSRGPARMAGLSELQGFLERGFAAFAALPEAERFIGEVVADERRVSRRLFAHHPDPFGVGPD
jgi:predicted transcriptional regulator